MTTEQEFKKKIYHTCLSGFTVAKERKNTGVGIGLSLAAEIVRRRNGTIKVFNAKNGGAEFQICFYKMLP